MNMCIDEDSSYDETLKKYNPDKELRPEELKYVLSALAQGVSNLHQQIGSL